MSKSKGKEVCEIKTGMRKSVKINGAVSGMGVQAHRQGKRAEA